MLILTLLILTLLILTKPLLINIPRYWIYYGNLIILQQYCNIIIIKISICKNKNKNKNLHFLKIYNRPWKVNYTHGFFI